MTKIDTLSPSFLAGFAGYAITGSATGFLIAAIIAWFVLTAVLVIAVAMARREPQRAPGAHGFEIAAE